MQIYRNQLLAIRIMLSRTTFQKKSSYFQLVERDATLLKVTVMSLVVFVLWVSSECARVIYSILTFVIYLSGK